MLIDTHCHIDCQDFDKDRDDVIARSLINGVEKMMLIGVRSSDWGPKMELVEQYSEQLYAVLGCHPLFLDDHKLSDIDLLETMILNHRGNVTSKGNKIVAIGEIGLDYFHKKPHIMPPDKKIQQQYFESQLRVAQKYQLPVILHVRKAHDEVIATLKKYHIVSGIAHAFNGSIQHAHQYSQLGFKVGLGGMITHPHSNKLHRLFGQIAIEDIVLETDAPDLTVFSHKGERNSPEYLPEVCEHLAKIKGLSYQEVAEITSKNAIQSLGL